MPPTILARLNLLSTRIPTLRALTPTSVSNLRTMTSAAPKIQWLVILPDHENALESRMAVRPDHLKALTPRVEDGFWQLGGAILGNVPQEGKPLDITGSCMLANAATKEEVIEELKNDVYFKSKVWNFEKIQIYPFKSAFIKGT